MNTLIGDPARIDEVTHYIGTTVRPFVESQAGNRGMALMLDAELGVVVVGSYWDSMEAMTLSEHAVETSRKEAAELGQGMFTVDHFAVPAFVRLSRPGPGAGVRIATVECPPEEIPLAARAFRENALPKLVNMAGLCSAQMLTDAEHGRTQVIVAYETVDQLAATRAEVARLRADTLSRTHAQVRAVGEYRLVFSSVREDGTNTLTQRWAELWNAGDRDGWQALTDQQAFKAYGPGGFRLAGREALDAVWDIWHEAFPDNRIVPERVHGDDDVGSMEARFQGTHTGTLRTPTGDIGATQRVVDLPFCETHRVTAGKIADFHLYFDQVELLVQLGRVG